MGSNDWPLPEVDLWAPVQLDDLPAVLLDASKREDWAEVRSELKRIMDPVGTDGRYGRALLQFVMQLPIASDPVFARYRGSIAIDHGDWDGLQQSIAVGAIEGDELRGVRDIILAPLDRDKPPSTAAAHQAVLFGAYEFQFERAVSRYRRWAQRLFAFHSDVIWSREDIPAGRHFRYRRLHDVSCLAFAESQGGRLQVALALAREAQHLGDEGEPIHEVAHDLEILVELALGQGKRGEFKFFGRIASPTGLSPLGTWETTFQLMPFYCLLDDGSLEWAARLGQQIAQRLGSPRGQLQAQSWLVAAELLKGHSANDAGLPGLLAEATRAAPGLKVLPLLLHALASKEPGDFVAAETVARQVGNVWAQVSALTWLVALNPRPTAVRWLRRLLDVTGWRRPILVPPPIAADAALGLTLAGQRGVSIVELTETGGRPNVTVEVALHHIDDPEAPSAARLAAVDALGRLGTSHSREILHRIGRRTDEVGLTARRILARRASGSFLSEREVEVLDLARHGLTNREVAERLSLSPHTIARHLANARSKMGAANRTEAAAKLEELRA